eukprot:CAMPEP_0178485424 /NCGR_PEP_ID=MMETSP0696-20121128/8266_1 /TAXON_ID=265572 /ORGANISM="Extubocellulus spinifer, Strain CCMP396" /LENGTH=223 /DNA_ID=CAMNT_0020113019 /DNA_START=15 /DNA_END=686 /DNA_ORIENTATION=+
MNTEGYFFIILDGVVQCDWYAREKNVPLTLRSGAMFDIKLLHHFPKSSVFADSTLSATTATESRIFRCSIEDMATISKSPVVKDAWQALLISTLSLFAESPWKWKDQEPTQPDEERQGQGGRKRSERDRMFLPLEEFEEPCPYSAGSGSATRYLYNHFLTTTLEEFEEPCPYSAGSGSATRYLYNHFLTTLRTKFLLPWPLMPWVSATRHVGSLPAPPHEKSP